MIEESLDFIPEYHDNQNEGNENDVTDYLQNFYIHVVSKNAAVVDFT
jgi:hypothetical protein